MFKTFLKNLRRSFLGRRGKGENRQLLGPVYQWVILRFLQVRILQTYAFLEIYMYIIKLFANNLAIKTEYNCQNNLFRLFYLSE